MAGKADNCLRHAYTCGGASHRLLHAAESQPRNSTRTNDIARTNRHPIPSPAHLQSSTHPVIFISIPSVLAFRLIHSLCFLSFPRTLTAYVTFPARPVGRLSCPSSLPLTHSSPSPSHSRIPRGDHLASTPVVAGSSWLHFFFLRYY